MFETWDWYMDRFFDWKVEDYLRTSVTAQKMGIHGPVQWAIPKSIQEISAATKMSEWFVRGSIRRLKKKKVVMEDGEGIRIKI